MDAARRPCLGRAGVRFVLSTSQDLPSLVEQGTFRPELYHRISTICLMVPPLRHRALPRLLGEFLSLLEARR